jgi:hypothetical protein
MILYYIIYIRMFDLSPSIQDIINIPSYGPVTTAMNGSTGLEWRSSLFRDPTIHTETHRDHENGTNAIIDGHLILEFRVLRGCSATKWLRDAATGVMRVEITRPPKQAFDQLPKVVIYRGQILGNRIVGNVYIEDTAASFTEELASNNNKNSNTQNNEASLETSDATTDSNTTTTSDKHSSPLRLLYSKLPPIGVFQMMKL